MQKDLTSSALDQQNILNNRYAVEAIQEETGLIGILFDGQFCFPAQEIADFFEVDERTVKRYLSQHEKELKKNGYEVLRGKRLNNFKLRLSEQSAGDMNVPSKVTQLGLFNFRAFLTNKN